MTESPSQVAASVDNDPILAYDENEDIYKDIQQQAAQPAHAQPKQRKLMLSKYTIYVTNQRMYIVGSNNRETMFRILEVDITQPCNEELSIIEDNVFFTRNEIMKVLSGLEESSEGGLTKKLTAVGLLGFIRFTANWYLSVITKKSPVSILGGHYLYHIDDTELIPVSNNYKKPDRHSEETRYLMTFANLDLNKTFYYSYTYDLTNSLQKNFMNNKKQSVGPQEQINFDYNEMFVWNAFLLKPIISASFDRIYDWFQPIIHGFIDQAKISVFDAKVYITIIARRSHHFAGARFLKRGVNDQGNVANEVETEQIVHDALTSPFHDPQGGFYNNPRYTSYVQHRGSIPLSWSQEIGSNIKLQTKPPINVNVVDPFYSAAALHFNNLFERYGAPVLVLNLIKQREKTPRESKLLGIFEECITYLNKFLIERKKISYTAWDMSRASKNRGQDVIEYLENYADETLRTTGIFHNGLNLKETSLQQGVCRTNCIDCLDRTNAAQFIIAKRALGYQLHALGFIDDPYLEYDSDVVNIMTEMFHDHGDTIALQYGGSHLVNTMETYRKINQWTSHSRDMIESIKRFYSNSFVDAQRQEAINLFLGNYVWEKGAPMLWDLDTDYYLHHDFLGTNLKYKPSYTHWYTDSNLIDFNRSVIKFLQKNNPAELEKNFLAKKYNPYPNFYENYFIELYVPRVYSSLKDVFEFNMNSTLRYVEDPRSAVTNKDTNSAKTKSKGNELEDENGLSFFTSPFETRKPQLINSKLKILNDDMQKKNKSVLDPSRLRHEVKTLTDKDEFTFLIAQIKQLFKNFENEYIYYPLNLKRFLNDNSPKLMRRVAQHSENYPVFDNSVNNVNRNSKEPSGFYNFNLDGFQESNVEFKHARDRSFNETNESLEKYNNAKIAPTVQLNDEIAYYNSVHFIKKLSAGASGSILSNDYIYDYHNSKVSANDLSIYSNYYSLNNVGNYCSVKVPERNYIRPMADGFLPNEGMNNNYFGPAHAPSIISESASSASSPRMNTHLSDFKNDYVIKETSASDNVDKYDQFPDIQGEGADTVDTEEEPKTRNGQIMQEDSLARNNSRDGVSISLKAVEDEDEGDYVDDAEATVIHTENSKPVTHPLSSHDIDSLI